ncbi:MAG: hypothetical protein KGZ66_09650 [Selenomonadales bacterium]|jgi:DNA-binding CsgD family transcriptional regulator|nr:hypothetical protein [Selenomonadales bacterium]
MEQIGFSSRRLSVIVFALSFAWLLAFPFEGQILYALTSYHGLATNHLVFGAMAAHFAGLLTAGFMVTNIGAAKQLLLFAFAFSGLASGAFFFPPSPFWTIALLSAAFMIGVSVAAWGFYFKHDTPKEERLVTMADALISANILMILLNLSAVHLSPHFGLSLAILSLVAAFLFARLLPIPSGDLQVKHSSAESDRLHNSTLGPLTFLCLFILVITINSGLMYHVQRPSFAHLEWLTSWYWAVPYIVALLVLRNLRRNQNRAYSLYVAIAMIGFSFIFFLLLGRSWLDYLVVDTLMLGACGMLDLFWGTTLGEMLDLGKNPARIMGAGLAANVLGVLLGGLLGEHIFGGGIQSQNPTLLALSIVCLALVLLPPLHNRLDALLKSHAFLAAFTALPAGEQDRTIAQSRVWGMLTEREGEIAALLVKGSTYRMIAGELHVSENTVKTHVKNIYSKIGVQSRAELMSNFIEAKSSPK